VQVQVQLGLVAEEEDFANLMFIARKLISFEPAKVDPN